MNQNWKEISRKKESIWIFVSLYNKYTHCWIISNRSLHKMTAVYFAPRNNTLLPSARFSTSFSFDERRRDYPKMEGAVCQAYPKDTQYRESLVVKANPPLRSDSKFNHVLIFCNGISTNFSKLPINKRKISILRIISFVTCYSKIEKNHQSFDSSSHQNYLTKQFK